MLSWLKVRSKNTHQVLAIGDEVNPIFLKRMTRRFSLASFGSKIFKRAPKAFFRLSHIWLGWLVESVCFFNLAFYVRMLRQHILLIDDDEDDHEIFITATQEISAEINCSSLFNALEALEKLQTRQLMPDLIFLDLNMPVMSGQQFLSAIKSDENLKSIPVVIFSTSSELKTVERLKKMGASDFITKPGLYNELVTILRPILT